MALLQPEAVRPHQSRDEALDRLRRLKSWSLFGSVAAFGTFVALAATHVTGVTAKASTGTAAGVPTYNSPQAKTAFFKNAGDGGVAFGGGGSGGSQAPAASTAVS